MFQFRPVKNLSFDNRVNSFITITKPLSMAKNTVLLQDIGTIQSQPRVKEWTLSAQSDPNLHSPQKLLVSSTIKKELISVQRSTTENFDVQ